MRGSCSSTITNARWQAALPVATGEYRAPTSADCRSPATQATKAELDERKQFEDLIRRPYFHVKPLDRGQLGAWNNYIDYILKKEDAGAIVRLFERCLVPCASYPGTSLPCTGYSMVVLRCNPFLLC